MVALRKTSASANKEAGSLVNCLVIVLQPRKNYFTLVLVVKIADMIWPNSE